MKYRIIILFSVILGFSSCRKKGEIREPVSQSGGEYIKESAERNQYIVSDELKAIQQYIKNDSLHKYYQSDSGFWYKYLKANIHDTITPQTGDVVNIEFNIKYLNNEIIYDINETSPKIYVVDKQEIMPGLRRGIKIMRPGERIVFLFPSHLGYGFVGDKDRIGSNQPIICEVFLKEIKQ
ncbi:gliding motility-associated peptidyl-prolyl isomerase GldI [Avrilella dinanensis]|uniref:gliding motility-associated peptidyl-prolyl isomerase GldI n=1 Tax=Avrilella dinanensis TaxID=2008672 RepID=UPI00240A00B3|nr:gliding motility-associated peptidyl-prolyl isomerase GldI [Avrilella dinanensis]